MKAKNEEIETVFVVDDDKSILEALESLVRSAGFRVRTYMDANSFLTSHRPDSASCLVLDVQLPGLSGLDLQHEMITTGNQMPIIFISGHVNIPMTVKAMKAGAVEFLTKPFDDEVLLDAIRLAIKKDREARKHQTEIKDLQERYRALTPREREVMKLVVQGILNKQIAAELGTTEITIKVHRGQVMHKMKAESLADLVRKAEKLGIGPTR